MSAEQTLFGTTLALYFAASVCYHVHLFAGGERARRFAPVLVALGALAHFAAIGVWCVSHHGFSILRDPAMPFSLVAFFLALAQLGVTARPGWAAVGSLVLPLAFAAQFYATWSMTGSTVQLRPASSLLSPHVLAILLGFSAFTLAFCLSILYLAQSRLLKAKRRWSLFNRLPPLESIATASHWLAALGFSMLTLGIITGAIAAPDHWERAWYFDPRTLISLIAWAIYAAYIGASMGMGWRGRRTTYFLIAGYLAVLVAFIASLAWPKNVGHTAAPPSVRAKITTGVSEC